MTEIKDMSIEELRADGSFQYGLGEYDVVEIPYFDELARRYRELELELADKNLEIEADDRNVNALMDQLHELSNKLAAKMKGKK